MTGEQKRTAAVIIRHYGAAHQKIKLCEECAELIQATCKSLDSGNADNITADMIEEMADVEILLMQFMTQFGEYWLEVFEETVGRKLTRQAERIKAGD